MRHSLMYMLVIVVLCICASGCIKSSEESKSSEVITPVKTGDASQDTTAVPVDGEAAVEPADGSEGEEEGEVEPAEPVDEGDSPLIGQWFALFGRHDLGVVDNAWKEGHRVSFTKDGQAVWVNLAGGGEQTMKAGWKLHGEKLALAFSRQSAAKSGLSKIAPLGIGRDEEIGLLSGEKPGLEPGAVEQVDANLVAVIEENYLALTDRHGRLMIYGRMLDAAPSEAPDVSGGWVGHIDMHDNFPADFEWDGETLTAHYEHNESVFRGIYVHGYFIGMARGSSGMSMAALLPTEEYWLDGVHCPDPYGEMHARFDFQRVD